MRQDRFLKLVLCDDRVVCSRCHSTSSSVVSWCEAVHRHGHPLAPIQEWPPEHHVHIALRTHDGPQQRHRHHRCTARWCDGVDPHSSRHAPRHAHPPYLKPPRTSTNHATTGHPPGLGDCTPAIVVSYSKGRAALPRAGPGSIRQRQPPRGGVLEGLRPPATGAMLARALPAPAAAAATPHTLPGGVLSRRRGRGHQRARSPPGWSTGGAWS